MMRSGSAAGNTAMQIGISMPKVPHEVPVAKAKNAATMKMMAGKSCCSPAALLATTPDTYSAAPNESVMLFSVHANVRNSWLRLFAICKIVGEVLFIKKRHVTRNW